MKKFFSLKSFKKTRYDEEDQGETEDEYVELNTDMDHGASSRVMVRPFVLDDFTDVKNVIEVLREGYTICLLNIGPLREKDMVELKRAINKLKKTIEAIGGDIAGFGEDYIVVVPSFAGIYRSSGEAKDFDD
ncbi:cell division protein SepF [Candidatus Woesearchaeota archaeon]|nr:cell division protein SepF [Candidatus Woesearchaeota archaeon]